MLKLLKDKDGHPVIRNDKPVYVQEDGTEIEFDVNGTITSIAQLKQEAKTRRQNEEQLTAKVNAFGDLDPAKAREALETVGKLDAKKLIDSGKLEEATALLNKGWQEKLDAEKKRGDTFESQLVDEKIGGNFARSKFIGEKMTVPPDMVQATFGKQFKLVDGKVVAYDGNGQPIHSKANPAEIAGFDEALEIVINNYPHRAALLKASQKGGGGAGGGNAGGGGNSKVKTRAEFDAISSPSERAQFIRDGGQVVDQKAA